IGNIQIPNAISSIGGRFGKPGVGSFRVNPNDNYKINTPNLNENGLLNPNRGSFDSYRTFPNDDKEKTNAGKDIDWMKDNYGSILQTAPIAMNAYQLAKLKKPREERLERLGNRYNPQYIDEASMVNKINNSYNLNAAKEASAGNLGNYQANARATMLDRGRLLSDAYFRANQANLQENRKAQDFNLGVDRVNLSQSNLEQDINAKNKGNYDTQKSKLLGQ